MSAIDYTDKYGVDISCVDDLDASLSLVDGQTAVAQMTARRITSPRGSVFTDTDYGTDVRAVLHGSISISPTQAARMVEAEAMKDARVDSAAAEVVWDAAGEELTVKCWIDTADDDSFALTLSVDDVSVSLLED